jgi:hypothetical protein
VKGFAPSPSKGDLLANEEFTASLSAFVMSSASEALKQRRKLRKEDSEGQDAMDDEEDGSYSLCRSLCTAIVVHITSKFLSSQSSESSRIAAWNFLDGLCRFSGSREPTPFLEQVLPAAAACLKRRSLHDAIACVLCVETSINCLGRSLLEKLNVIALPLLELTNWCFSGEVVSDEVTLLGQRLLHALRALTRSLGAFLSPLLGEFVRIALTSCQPSAAKAFQDFGRDLVSGIPHRLLLPAVQEAIKETTTSLSSMEASGELDATLLKLQRLSVFQIWMLLEASPEFVVTINDVTTNSLLRLLGTSAATTRSLLEAGIQPHDLPARFFRQNLRRLGPITNLVASSEELDWTKSCSDGSLGHLHRLAAASFTQFALRLELDDLKLRFKKVLDWARGKQALLLEKQKSRCDVLYPDAEDASRTMALMSLMSCLASEATGISSEMLLPLVTKDLGNCLVACRTLAMQLAAQHKSVARKRRKAAAATGGNIITSSSRAVNEVLQSHSWWWFEVGTSTLDFASLALGQLARSTSGVLQTKLSTEAVEVLREPCSELLDLFEFLPPIEESPLSLSFLQAIQKGLVGLAATANGEEVKGLVHEVLTKSRADDSEVRLNAVRSVHQIWKDLGVQVVPCLSDVVMFASELLEDEDPRVETAVRAMIKTMEDCTGESLQESLKH